MSSHLCSVLTIRLTHCFSSSIPPPTTFLLAAPVFLSSPEKTSRNRVCTAMSGLTRRMSNSSQTSNSPLLPRSNADGTHGWRDVLENKMTWAYVLTSIALCVRCADWAKVVREHHVLRGCGVDTVQSPIWVSRSLDFGYACVRPENRFPMLIPNKGE